MIDRSQFDGFMQSVYTAFPNVYQTLRFGVDLEATETVWYNALKAFAIEELRAVLNEWIHSRDVPFKANEIGFLQNIIRARIYFQRDQIAKIKRSQEDAQKTTKRRESYRPIAGLGEIYAIGKKQTQWSTKGE